MTTASARVLVIGHACLDSVALVDARVPDDGKLEARRIWTGPGGPATNAAIALRRLGHRVALSARIGADAPGRLVRDTLIAEGIDLLDPLVEGGSTSLAQIRARGADRSIVWRRGKLPVLQHDPTELARQVRDADLLYLDGHEVSAGNTALDLAFEDGIPVVADLGSLREGAGDWPRRLGVAVVSPRWARERWPGLRTLRERITALGDLAGADTLVGVTLGASGGFGARRGEILPWTARKTGVVDTTGAGDAFHAGLADAVLRGVEADEALALAATLAAAVCRAPGGHAALPSDREELLLWHGRWGFRPGPDEGLLDSEVDQGTATR